MSKQAIKSPDVRGVRAESISVKLTPRLSLSGESVSSYRAFLESKIVLDERHGYRVDPSEVSAILKPHQLSMPSLFDDLDEDAA